MSGDVGGGPPSLDVSSCLSLRRQGGIAHIPGLAKPRYIRCDRLDDAQRERLLDLLTEAARRAAETRVTVAADQRIFHLAVEDAEGRCQWSAELDEQRMPEELLLLWRDREALKRG
ncbi:hypothetical protein IEI94_17880 [Halomonas sp. ML-15]|uniref:protealysin inhibitor emfourin n=1 Tax=Halomonas sp. ML-15 TaxID=2773305 RepID=UPI001746AB96|nr:protealysin inhibitor emfourin [Halomonas sp. ML-15]MBD3897730.1 hypothetical protein [Halomonas sp. ML-15]